MSDSQPDAQKPSPKLLEALVCPATGGRLEYDAGKAELISKVAPDRHIMATRYQPRWQHP